MAAVGGEIQEDDLDAPKTQRVQEWVYERGEAGATGAGARGTPRVHA